MERNWLYTFNQDCPIEEELEKEGFLDFETNNEDDSMDDETDANTSYPSWNR